MWPSSLESSGQNFECAPQLWYLHHESRTFLSPWFCTLISRDCTYCDGLIYVILGTSYYILKFRTKYFLQPPHLLRHLTFEGWSFILNFNKCGIRNIVTNRCIQGDSRIVDINERYGSNSQWLWFQFLILWTYDCEKSVRLHGIFEKVF